MIVSDWPSLFFSIEQLQSDFFNKWTAFSKVFFRRAAETADFFLIHQLTQLEFFSIKQVFSQPCKFFLTEYWTLSQLSRSGIFVLQRAAPTGPDKPSPGPSLLAGTAESPQFPEFKNRKQSLYVLPITWYHISTSFLKSWKNILSHDQNKGGSPKGCPSNLSLPMRGPFLPQRYGTICKIVSTQHFVEPWHQEIIPSRLKCVRSLWMYVKEPRNVVCLG